MSDDLSSILYELFIYSEWKPDPDLFRGDNNVIPYSKQSVNRILNLLKPELTLVDYLSNFISQLQSWQICLGDDGKVVAVLQDTVLEIRTKRGNFSNVVARTGVPRDPNPQWRKMAWSPDCSLLAISHSNGKVSFYDLLATNLFNIPADCSQPLDMQCTDTTHALAGIIFLTNRVMEQKWSCELILIDYKGSLRSFFISPTDGFKLNHKFNFDGGASTVAYHSHHNMLFISGLPSSVEETSNSTIYGIRGWRLLNDPPFYKLSVNYDKQQPISLATWFFNYLFNWKKTKQSVIIKAVISSNGSTLACLHADGSLSFWQLPILKLIKLWNLMEQPSYDLPNPLAVNSKKQKIWPVPDDLSEYTPIDISWWTDEEIIVSRINGSVSICNIKDMHTMLGDKPVFLQGHPQISHTFDNSFLSMECEAVLISANRLRRKSDTENDSVNVKELKDNENADDDEDEKISFANWTSETIRAILYIITDMERFQPKPKKLHLLSRIYRLLCLKSTTPDDLYLRKIENADYEEALLLAQKYELDSDLVYQQRWRTSVVSTQSIKDYLNKVSKKIWVIQQCCDRVPENLSAARELLEFGLKLTNKEIFKSITSTVDKKTFTEKNLWNEITLEELSVHTSDILRYRYSMLFYLDRLDIYKAIIKCESSTYSAEEYNRLRINTICRSAIEFAKEGRVEALICLWPHLCDISLQLLVLQSLPETLDPLSYKSLLPSYNLHDSNDLYRKLNRQADWCEKDIFRSIWSGVEMDELEIEDNVDGVELILPSSNLTEWYLARAHQIEEMCGLSGVSLLLIGFAIEKNVPGLENLYSLLTTLDILLYDINIEQISLKQLENYSQYEVENLLMSQTNEETILDDMKTLLFPYLERCTKLSSVPGLKETLLREYVLNLSLKNLNLALKVFQGTTILEINVQQCLIMAEDSFLSQEDNNNLSLCFDILEALPEASDDSITPSHLIKVLDEMERYLNACQLMENHGIHISYCELRKIIGNSEEMQDLLKRTAHDTTTSKTNGADWNELLSDLLQLHSLIFAYEDNELCHEIFASAMLSSSNKLSIMSAEQVLTCQMTNLSPTSPTESRSLGVGKNKLPYKINVTHRVPFVKSIELVLKSAKEYFNSASNLNDRSLDFSWACLQLIKEENSDIQYEKNLILALKIINDFELSILPVKVRSCPSIELIEECLDFDENAYRYVDKVLKLAKLLAVKEDEKKREIVIVSLCAIKSIEREDYEEAKKLGKRLISVSEGPSAAHAAAAAQHLGMDASLADLPLRHQLIDLALLHCDAQHIETLLQIRSSVESEILQSEINNIVNITKNVNTRHVNLQDSMESTEDDYLDALTSPIVENRVITTVVEKYIQKPLTALGDKKSWKNALNFGWTSDSSKSVYPELQNKNNGKLACHMFYAHLHKDCHVSHLATQYNKFSTPDVFDPQLVMLHALIRNNLLQDCIKYGSSELAIVEALVQCAEYTLSEDTAYCLSQLLSTCHSSGFSKYLNNIQLDIRTLHTILYFYCLMNYINQHNLPDDAFIQSPIKLISEMLKFAQSQCDEDQNEAVKGLLNCKNTMDQLIEAKNLIKNGCPIDLELFAKDDLYRKTMILNISKTYNKEMFELAVKLSQKYNVPKQDVIVNYLSYVILHHENIGFANCNLVISDENLLSQLSGDMENILERFNNEVWTKLDGRDHNTLILYLTLISNMNSRYLIHGLNAKEHLKLIKKCKSACSGLNYKYIINGPSQDEFSDYALTLLTKDNIGVVTKFLRNLPTCFNFNFNSSKFYSTWLLHYFFNIPESIQTSKKWMQQHRECLSYFSKLNQDDMLSYTKEILFGTIALEKLPPSTRIQIAFQTADYCQHEHSNNENINIKSKQVEVCVSWEDVGIKITRWGKFLENFHSDTVKTVIRNNNFVSSRIWRNIECSRGIWSSMLCPLVELLLDNNFPMKELFVLMKCLDDEMTVNDLLTFTIENKELTSSVLGRITKCLLEMRRENITISSEVLDKMKIYSSSSLLSSKQRLELMSLYTVKSDHADVELLERISWELIACTWDQETFDNFKDFNIVESSERVNVMKTLIEGDTNWEKLKALVDLINMWPLSTVEEDKNETPHVQLIMKLINKNENIDENIPLLKLLMSKQAIPSEDISWIVSKNDTDNIVGKLWLCLLSSDKEVHRTVLPAIALEIKDLRMYEDFLSDQLFLEILNKRLFSCLIKTKLYPKLVNCLFKIDSIKSPTDTCDYTVDMAIADLLEKNHKAEAGALKMSAAGIPNTLKGFNEALLYYKL
ncbi:NBAS subunit of NRZ tethering complex-like [Arctopsyche grandis]|uniref:NBAS subunit of NRZ tethering complex-like n=1 Tax=Arctopsyche grandis TaxID=121162 RepID=UPI00406D8D6C